MPAKRKISNPHIMNEAAIKFADGTASRHALKDIGVPASRYPYLKRAADEELAAFKGRCSAVLAETAEKMAKRLKNQADNIPLSQLPVSLGIVLTKHSELTGPGATNVHQALHLHLGGGSASALRAILGPAAGVLHEKPVNPTREEL